MSDDPKIYENESATNDIVNGDRNEEKELGSEDEPATGDVADTPQDEAENKDEKKESGESADQESANRNSGTPNDVIMSKDFAGEAAPPDENFRIEIDEGGESALSEVMTPTEGEEGEEGQEELKSEPSQSENKEDMVLRGLYEDINDKFLRVLADFENYKKRVIKEKADIMAYGNEQLIKELLNVVDNLERALDHTEAVESDSSIVAGIKLVHRQFLSVLEKFGVKPITVSSGERFDPQFHQAIEHISASEITPGLVLSEILRGYTLNGKLIRPSLVAVSKGEDGEEAEPQNDEFL